VVKQSYEAFPGDAYDHTNTCNMLCSPIQVPVRVQQLLICCYEREAQGNTNMASSSAQHLAASQINQPPSS
jgi:hypothetical protein